MPPPTVPEHDSLPAPIPAVLPPVPPQITIVRGLQQVLAFAPLLNLLAERSGQRGAADYLEYYLTNPYVGPKIPCLCLLHTPGPAPTTPDDLPDLLGSVLLYEYRTRGLATGIFITDDDGGARTVLAPPEDRARIAAAVAMHLLRGRARLVMLSLRAAPVAVQHAMHTQLAAGSTTQPAPLWATRERLLHSELPLLRTYDETLACMGKHTRRNLRYYERRITAELAAHFVPDPSLSETEFLALNRRCAYPVPDPVAQWRFRNLTRLSGGFLVGIRVGDHPFGPLPEGLQPGEWISLLGGRRHHGTTEIGWQMNRNFLEAFSLSTAMRSALFRHEIALGTQRLFFEGGTPHSIKAAFSAEPVLDLLVSRPGRVAAALRRLVPRLLPPKNFLAELLEDPALHWHEPASHPTRQR